jgi:hypothetical protein
VGTFGGGTVRTPEIITDALDGKSETRWIARAALLVIVQASALIVLITLRAVGL